MNGGMTAFWVVAALLVAGALAFVLPPLLRSRAREARPSRSAVNVDLYRGQLAELERERAAGALSEAQYREGRQEIERRLLEDVAPADSRPAGAPSRRIAVALGVLVPMAAVLLYAALGNFAALDPRAAQQAAAPQLTRGQIVAMVERLAQRLQQRPDDVEGWQLLARSLAALGRHQESAKAYAHLLALAPEDIESLARAGSVEFELKNFAAAAKYWERILALVPADSEFAGSVRESIAEARSATRSASVKPAEKGSAGKAITGIVKISPQLAAQVSPGDTLFVFARPAEGSRMPLAIVRAKAGELPYRFRLDDSQAMAPGRTLSSQSRVVVGARISKSGNAAPQAGDLQVASAPVAPGTRDLEVVIDQVVK
jgi:cytochrome c-type biogenesis protein CcmH